MDVCRRQESYLRPHNRRRKLSDSVRTARRRRRLIYVPPHARGGFHQGEDMRPIR